MNKRNTSEAHKQLSSVVAALWSLMENVQAVVCCRNSSFAAGSTTKGCWIGSRGHLECFNMKMNVCVGFNPNIIGRCEVLVVF